MTYTAKEFRAALEDYERHCLVRPAVLAALKVAARVADDDTLHRAWVATLATHDDAEAVRSLRTALLQDKNDG